MDSFISLLFATLALANTAQAGELQWTLDSATGRLMINRTDWQGEIPAEIRYWDDAGKEMSQTVTPENGWKMERRQGEHGCRLVCRQEKLGFVIPLDYVVAGDVLTVSVHAADVIETGAARLKTLRLLPRFGSAREGESGYLIIPKDVGVLCLLRDKAPNEYQIPVYVSFKNCNMPLFGMIRGKRGLACIVASGQFDAQLHISTNWGPRREYAIDPSFTLRSFVKEERSSEDLTVQYHFLPADAANWLDVAKCYRQYNTVSRNIRTLRQRTANSPELAYSAQAIEVRLRLGVKPVPTPVLEQTPETEPPVRIFLTFTRVRDILTEFHRQGISRAEFCLVGWNRGGHDGRFPQIFPVEPVLGGEAELRKTISCGQSLGYQMVAHDCYHDAYRISEDWNEEYIRKNASGEMCKGGQYGGGQSYLPCRTRAYELFVQRDVPRIRELGFKGLHYSDVLSIVGPNPCYDSRHRATPRQDAEATKRMLAFCSKSFGGVQSEGPLDFTADVLDRVLYISIHNKKSPLAKLPYVDRIIPLYPAVYHGTLLYNVWNDMVNALPGEADYLKNIEYGAMPVAYFYGHFWLDPTRDWLGSRDYHYDDQEGLRKAVAGIRQVHDDLQKLKHLQMEFIEGHRQIVDEVFETTYSNGQRIVVNYREQSHTLSSGEIVPARGWLLLRPAGS